MISLDSDSTKTTIKSSDRAQHQPNENRQCKAAGILRAPLRHYVGSPYWASVGQGVRRRLFIIMKFGLNYLQVAATSPAFTAFRWLCPSRLQPLMQCTTTLSYMKSHPYNTDSDVLNQILDEYSMCSKASRTHEAAWRMLHESYYKIKAGFG